MSWSISFIGAPEKIVTALQENSEKLSGQSKIEYDSALSSLVGLVKENFGGANQLLKINASGHGFANSVEQLTRQCTVSIEVFYSTLL